MTREDLQSVIFASTRGHSQSRVVDVRALRAYQIARKLGITLNLADSDIRTLKHTHRIVSRFLDPATATMEELEEVGLYLDGPRPKPNHEMAERFSEYVFGCQRSDLTAEQKQEMTRAVWGYTRKHEATS